MADRFFPNTMPDFVAEATSLEGGGDGATVSAPGDSSSLAKLLAMPYPVLSENFKRAALDLKETVRFFFLSLRFPSSERPPRARSFF